MKHPQPTSDTPVEDLYNLSNVSAGWLREEGIETFGDLQQADLVELWVQLKSRHYQVTKLMYYALWGAVNNRHWEHIPDEEKDKITQISNDMKDSTS